MIVESGDPRVERLRGSRILTRAQERIDRTADRLAWLMSMGVMKRKIHEYKLLMPELDDLSWQVMVNEWLRHRHGPRFGVGKPDSKKGEK